MPRLITTTDLFDHFVVLHEVILDLHVHDVEAADRAELNVVVLLHSVEIVERFVVGCCRCDGRVVDVVGVFGNFARVILDLKSGEKIAL